MPRSPVLLLPLLAGCLNCDTIEGGWVGALSGSDSGTVIADISPDDTVFLTISGDSLSGSLTTRIDNCETLRIDTDGDLSGCDATFSGSFNSVARLDGSWTADCAQGFLSGQWTLER
jgi:hypothetical protein